MGHCNPPKGGGSDPEGTKWSTLGSAIPSCISIRKLSPSPSREVPFFQPGKSSAIFSPLLLGARSPPSLLLWTCIWLTPEFLSQKSPCIQSFQGGCVENRVCGMVTPELCSAQTTQLYRKPLCLPSTVTPSSVPPMSFLWVNQCLNLSPPNGL